MDINAPEIAKYSGFPIYLIPFVLVARFLCCACLLFVCQAYNDLNEREKKRTHWIVLSLTHGVNSMWI